MYMYHFRQKRISDYNKLQVTKRRFLDLKFIKIKVKWHVAYQYLVISWRSVLLVQEPGVHRENHRPVASH